MKTLLVLFAAMVVSAQEPAPVEKPTPQKKARELMDRAVEGITATQPEVQVAGLIHLGELYAEFDKKKSLELFEQAFAASAGLPTSPVNKLDYMQARVISFAAEVDANKGIELLTKLNPPQTGRRDNRVQPIRAIVKRLIAQKEYDRAAELITTLGSQGEFAYAGADDLLCVLPADDPRRPQLFSAATTAYGARSTGPFTEFVSRHWKDVPAQMAEAAVDAILRPLLTEKPSESYSRTISSQKGAVSFDSRADAELFNLIHVIRAINPKRAEQLMEQRIGLREAVTQFPEGVQSMGNDISSSISSGSRPNPEDAGRQRLQALANTKSMEARAAASKDLNRALALAEEIPVPFYQAATFASIAMGLAEVDAAKANAVLTRSVKALGDVKEPGLSVGVWVQVATAAHRAKDDERARLSLDKALDNAAVLFKADTQADSPNGALREYWPSTQNYRRIIYAAATMWGVDAENMLHHITDAEINQLVTIEMARALLGKPTRETSIMVDRQPKR